MKFKVIQDTAGFRELEDAWSSLISWSRCKSLFLTWPWLFSWHENMGGNEELYIVVATEGSRIRAVAPLALTEEGPLPFQRKVLQFLGQKYSYHLSFIAESDREKELGKGILGYLFTKRRDFDLIRLAHLSSANGLPELVTRVADAHGLKCHKTTHDPCKVIELPSTIDVFYESLDRKFSKRLKYDLRRIARDFDMEFFFATDPIEADWNDFTRLHKEIVSSKGGQTILSNEHFSRFYLDASRHALREGSLRLAVLKLNGKTVGVLFGIVHHDTFNYINIGYDTDYPKYSIGFVLPLLCIKSSIDENLRYFDLLGGGGDYKEKLGSKEMDGSEVLIYRTRIFALVDRIRDNLRSLKHSHKKMEKTAVR